MAAKYILAGLAAVFLVLGLLRGTSGRRGQVRTWLLISAMFALVSAWLFVQS